MADAIEYEQFEPTGQAGGELASPADLSRLSDIPMELSVEIGRTHMTVGETLDLRVGSVVALERLAGETADLLVNGSPIARGEVVVIDEQYGLRITEILDGQQEGASPELASPAEGTRGSADDGQPMAAAADAATGAEDADEQAAEGQTPN